MNKWIVAGLVLFLIVARVDAQTTKPATTRAVTQEDLEKEFAEKLTGATLVGKFTEERAARPDRPAAAEPKEDRYTLTSVQKLYGDNWLFVARIQFGDKDVKVPIMLPVKWAGDTPVITVTDAKIPGMGTYTARVMVFRDHYSGYWSGGDHGGNMWGRIEHGDAPASDAPATPQAPKAPAPSTHAIGLGMVPGSTSVASVSRRMSASCTATRSSRPGLATRS